MADERGLRKTALTRLEHALNVEYERRPDVINLAAVRSDYTDLLKRYEALVDASATLETTPPQGLARRIVAAAEVEVGG